MPAVKGFLFGSAVSFVFGSIPRHLARPLPAKPYHHARQMLDICSKNPQKVRRAAENAYGSYALSPPCSFMVFGVTLGGSKFQVREIQRISIK
jgi:hypothetical protein